MVKSPTKPHIFSFDVFSNLDLSVGYGYTVPSIFTSTLRDNIDEGDVRHCLIKKKITMIKTQIYY